MEAIQIGPFYLNWHLLTLMGSAAVAYGVMIIQLKFAAMPSKPYGDVLFNTLMISFLTWKLAPALLHPLSFLVSPLKYIMMQGGAKEWRIALIAATLYIGYSYTRRTVSLFILADLFAYGVLSFIGARGIIGGWVYGTRTNMPWGVRLMDGSLKYHPINVYELLVAFSVLAVIWLSRSVPGEGMACRLALMYGGAGLFAISLLDIHYAAGSFFYLTYTQWVYIGLTLIGLFLPQWFILWASIQKRSQRLMTTEDSLEQQEQQCDNAELIDQIKEETSKEEESIDKKLDGPNRPAD